jgi:hypothetical protein
MYLILHHQKHPQNHYLHLADSKIESNLLQKETTLSTYNDVTYVVSRRIVRHLKLNNITWIRDINVETSNTRWSIDEDGKSNSPKNELISLDGIRII